VGSSSVFDDCTLTLVILFWDSCGRLMYSDFSHTPHEQWNQETTYHLIVYTTTLICDFVFCCFSYLRSAVAQKY
jgi:hypothetical protein